MTSLNRRPLQSRSWGAMRKLAAWLASTSISPNAISIFSVLFSAVAASALMWCAPPWGTLLCAVGIQLRLLCNLLDGMVAVEGGKRSALGDLYNELPDRVSDIVLIVALGYACDWVWLGWLAATAAVLTAYVRALGGSLGLPQDFRGPQSKSQRMAVMTVGCLVSSIEFVAKGDWPILSITLSVIALGAILTCIGRVRAMAVLLRERFEQGA